MTPEHATRLTFHKFRVMITMANINHSLQYIFSDTSSAYCWDDRFASYEPSVPMDSQRV